MAATLFQPFPMVSGRRAQIWRHQPQFRRPRHFHEEPELNLVVKGQGVLGVGERALVVEAGDLVLLHAGQDHVLLDASHDFDLFVMALRPELAARAGAAALSVTSQGCRLSDAELRAATARLRGLSESRDASVLESQLGDWFRTAVTQVARGHVVSRRALEFVRAELAVSGGALAKRLRTPQSAISRRFRHDLGVRFVEFRSRLRLMRFVELVDRGHSLSRAALEAGFGSYAQCHRVFHRMLGCAPQEYFAGARVAVDDARFAVAP